jgi:hypothetical protein
MVRVGHLEIQANYEAWVEKGKHGSRGRHGLKFVTIMATQGPGLAVRVNG